MAEEKKKGFFARLGLGQSGGDCGCCCPSVQIVSEEEVEREQKKREQAEKRDSESDAVDRK